MTSIFRAIYISLIIGFLRRLLQKLIPDGVTRTLWLNLFGVDYSIRVYTSDNSILLHRIRDKMIEHNWNPTLLSIGNHVALRNIVYDVDDPNLDVEYDADYAAEMRDVLRELGCIK